MPSFLFDFRGECAALSAALIWAIASVIYIGIGRQLPPLLLNLLKGLMAIAFVLITLLVQGKVLPQMNAQATGLLLLSGAIGIGLGDTAYFEALTCLGARRTLVLESLSPTLTALLAITFLREWLPTLSWLGILLTIVGVTWVIVERTPEADDHAASAHPASWNLPLALSENRRGILCGILAAIGQASGAVLSRAALAGTAIDPLWSTLLRLGAGVLVLLLWATLQRYSLQVLKPLRSGHFLAVLAGTAFFSTYLAIWLQQLSLKYAPAGVAQALSATSPLFVIPLAIALGERVSLRAILGVMLAVVGIWFLFWRG